jgi:predicted PurR-regulated permease PerM
MDAGTLFAVFILAVILFFMFAPTINYLLEKLNQKIRRMNDRRK